MPSKLPLDPSQIPGLNLEELQCLEDDVDSYRSRAILVEGNSTMTIFGLSQVPPLRALGRPVRMAAILGRTMLERVEGNRSQYSH